MAQWGRDWRTRIVWMVSVLLCGAIVNQTHGNVLCFQSKTLWDLHWKSVSHFESQPVFNTILLRMIAVRTWEERAICVDSCKSVTLSWFYTVLCALYALWRNDGKNKSNDSVSLEPSNKVLLTVLRVGVNKAEKYKGSFILNSSTVSSRRVRPMHAL